jgi:hypothetical protein
MLSPNKMPSATARLLPRACYRAPATARLLVVVIIVVRVILYVLVFEHGFGQSACNMFSISDRITAEYLLMTPPLS